MVFAVIIFKKIFSGVMAVGILFLATLKGCECMYISSLNTQKAKKQLEKIESDGVLGKNLLKDFLNREIKTLLKKESTQGIINASQKPESNIYKFAMILKQNDDNMDLFKKAIEFQASSFGTKEKGLFNKLIYPIRNNWINSKSKIKAFLLAHKDRWITLDEDKYTGENMEYDINEEDRKSLRMKKFDISDKLKSSRLSNVLKVFIALVMWDLITIQEQQNKHQIKENGKIPKIKTDEKERLQEETRNDQEEDLKDAERILGTDKEYFYDENDSNIFSRAYRHFFPDKWSWNHQQKYDKHTIEPVKGNVKIFPKGKPLPVEVRQAGIGDCYFMSTLISLAKTNPKAIMDCFVQGLSEIEKTDKIDIRFFAFKNAKNAKKIQEQCIEYLCLLNKESRTEEENQRLEELSDIVINGICEETVIITVDKNKVMMPQYIRCRALWPKLLEKAYAVYRSKGYDLRFPDVKRLNSGSALAALQAIVGIENTSTFSLQIFNEQKNLVPDLEFPEEFKSENIVDTLKTKLKESKSLVCLFKGDFTVHDIKTGEKIKILGEHMYSVVGINEDQKYIRLIEPNKCLGRRKKRIIGIDKKTGEAIKECPKEGGHIAMSFDDFKENFREITYTK